MRKIKKIMIITVAVLLVLTLVSSCLVSGIFAKYTTKKTASAQMLFEQFGVGLAVELPLGIDTLTELGATVTTADNNESYANLKKGGVYKVTIDNLPIGPGDDYRKLVKFTFSGNANVPVRISVTTDISYNDTNFTVPSGVGGLAEDTISIPINFWCTAYNGSTVVEYTTETDGFSCGDPFPGANTSATARANNVANNLRKNIDFSGYSGNVAYKDFSPSVDNGKIVFHPRNKNKTSQVDTSKEIYSMEMGYQWPFVTGENASAKETYIVQHNTNPSISITYTVSIVQTA